MLDPALQSAVAAAGPTWTCRALGILLSSYYHRHNDGRSESTGRTDGDPAAPDAKSVRPSPAWTLTMWQRFVVFVVLCCDEFCEPALAQVFCTLLDRGICLCSISTMYRVLRDAGLLSDRRPQRTYPSESRKKPRLEARRPNAVWSWDITMLHGPPQLMWHLYVIIDIFSRKVVGWRLENAKDAGLARATTIPTQNPSSRH